MLDDYVKEVIKANGDINEIKRVIAQAAMDAVYCSDVREEAGEYLNKEYNL